MNVGRPTDYTDEILTKSKTYIESCVDEVEEYHRGRGDKSNTYERLVKVKLPTVEGLARYLGIARSTVYEWKDSHVEFSDIIEKLLANQAEKLIKAKFDDPNTTLEEKKSIFTALGWNYTVKDKKLFISQCVWLEPIEKKRKSVESEISRLELQNNQDPQRQNTPIGVLCPILRG